jgi:hypothetical protein
MTLEELAEHVNRLSWGALGVPEPLASLLIPPRRRRRLIAGGPAGRLEFQLLAALGLSGWSVRDDLVRAVNYGRPLQTGSGMYLRALARVAQAGLWQTRQVHIARRPLSLVRLTDLGRELLLACGVSVVVSEWERIEQAHRGRPEEQPAHTAAICAFLYHARRYGYETQACPDSQAPAEPDALIARGDEVYYVEVQRRGGAVARRAQKWWNLYQLQGCVVICATSPADARRFAAEARIAGARQGYVTDLATLAHGRPPELWTWRWRSLYSPLEPCG